MYALGLRVQDNADAFCGLFVKNKQTPSFWKWEPECVGLKIFKNSDCTHRLLFFKDNAKCSDIKDVPATSGVWPAAMVLLLHPHICYICEGKHMCGLHVNDHQWCLDVLYSGLHQQHFHHEAERYTRQNKAPVLTWNTCKKYRSDFHS